MSSDRYLHVSYIYHQHFSAIHCCLWLSTDQKWSQTGQEANCFYDLYSFRRGLSVVYMDTCCFFIIST
ncbi:hypothetical protein SRHO_G00148530 [Serrasalmus rhombeus]